MALPNPARLDALRGEFDRWRKRFGELQSAADTASEESAFESAYHEARAVLERMFEHEGRAPRALALSLIAGWEELHRAWPHSRQGSSETS